MMESLKKETVVVVDDDGMMRDMLKITLRGDGYSVIGEAANGVEAVSKCGNLKPDVVLLDINMPQMDGLQALTEIHKICPDTIVIMISAEATMEKVSEAIKKGAAGFVVKPLNAANVLERVSACLRSHRKTATS